MKRTTIITILLCVAASVCAQKFTDHLQQKVNGQGTVVVNESQDITELVNGKEQPVVNTEPVVKKETVKEEPKKVVTREEKKDSVATRQHHRIVGYETAKTDSESGEVDMSKKIIRNGQKVMGYRIQVFAGGNSREDKAKATNIGKQLKMYFPNQPIYTHFYSPRWICRMGNFLTYAEAAEVLKDVKRLGYSQACIVKGKITVQVRY